MRVVQLDSIETARACSARSLCKQPWQLLGKASNMRQVHVGNTFPRAKIQSLELARIEHVLELGAFECRKPRAHRRIIDR